MKPSTHAVNIENLFLQILIASATVVAGSANAQDTEYTREFYFGLGFGQSTLTPLDSNGEDLQVDKDTAIAGQLIIGADLTPRLSAEFHYSNLGKVSLANQPQSDAAYTDAGISGLLYLTKKKQNRSGLALYTRLGVGRIETDSEVEVSRENRAQIIAGAGLEFTGYNGLGMRADYLYFDKDAASANLTLLYRFGTHRRLPEPPLVLDAPETLTLPVTKQESVSLPRIGSDDLKLVQEIPQESRAPNPDTAQQTAPADLLKTDALKLPLQSTRPEFSVPVAETTQAPDPVEFDASASVSFIESTNITTDISTDTSASVNYADESYQLLIPETLPPLEIEGTPDPSLIDLSDVQIPGSSDAAITWIEQAGTDTTVFVESDDSVIEDITDYQLSSLTFLIRSTDLTEKSIQAANEVSDLMSQNPNVYLEIAAHTDNRGNPDGNMELSKKRAIAVARYLVSTGIEYERLQAIAFGGTRPIASNETVDGRHRNRRVELKFVPSP